MKKTLLPLLLLASMALSLPFYASCTKDPESGTDDPGTQPEQLMLKPGVYTFTASPLKGKWEAGDKIFVHGSYGPNAQMITLSAADISADGKTASAYLDQVTKYPFKPDGLYAAWPGEDIVTEDELMDDKTLFKRTDILLAAAYLSGTSFTFKDIVCGLRFKVSGFTDFCMASNNRTGMDFKNYDVEYTSKYEAFFNYASGDDPFLKGKITDGSVMLWFPGTQAFSQGYTIYFGNDGNWSVAYTVNKATFPIGEITDLGDITAALQPYDGPGPNMPVLGQRTDYPVVFNELSGLCLSKDEDFLWAVDDNGKLGKISFEGEVLWKKSYSFDPEAVTLDPATGDLLVGNEEPCAVYRVPAPDFNSATKLFNIPGTSSFGNAGVEGLTYYKDGKVYVGTQTGSYLFCINLSTGEMVGDKLNLRSKYPTITEIADLCYDPLTDWLWVIDSENRKITVLSGDASHLIGIYSVPGTGNAESVCVDHKHSCIWVGNDAGSTSYIYKFEISGLDDFNIKE